MLCLNEKVELTLTNRPKLTIFIELQFLELYNSIIDLLTEEINSIIQKNLNLKEKSKLLCTILGKGENTASQIVDELS